MSGWIERLAWAAGQTSERPQACILLWMSGGPSHLDTFDPKPRHENGGPFREIATAVPGIRISEHLPQVAKAMQNLVVVRSMTSKEADHGRASHLVRTGRSPEAVIQYPTLGSFISKELGPRVRWLPNFVSIAPYRSTNLAAYNSGFLGPQHAPFVVGDVTPLTAQLQDPASYLKALRVEDLRPVARSAGSRETARLDLLRGMEASFAAAHPDIPVRSHQTALRAQPFA